jgi:hypothetical protein
MTILWQTDFLSCHCCSNRDRPAGAFGGCTSAEALKLRRRDRQVASSDVLEVEALAAGLLGDEAQGDRLGRADVEQAARSPQGQPEI